MKRAALALVILLTLVTLSAFSQSLPQSMNFQGRLAKPDGTPVPDNAAQSVTFRLFANVSGGTTLWSQTSNVAVRNGAFAAKLDFSTGFTIGQSLSSVFAAAPYLEIQVGSEAPLAPRQPFASVPYAFTAGTALSVPNGSIGLSQIAGGVLNFSNIGGQITGSQIASGTITASNLAAALQSPLAALAVVSYPPFLAGSVGTGTRPFSVAMSGSLACVVNFDSSNLQIFDVSNPANPILRGSIATISGPQSVAVSGGIACVVSVGSGNGVGTLQVFDISNPASPVLRGSANTPGSSGLSYPDSVAISGNYAYVGDAGGSAGTVQVFDIGAPATPVFKGSANTTNFVGSVAVSGSVVCAAAGTFLKVIDVSNPASPIVRGSIAMASPLSVAVAGSAVYAVGANTLQIFDISNPVNPVLRGNIATASDPRSVAAAGGYAYVVSASNGSGNGKLQVFDVSAPANPLLKNSVGTGVYPDSVAVQGNTVCVVNLLSNTLQAFQNGALALSNSLQVGGGGTFNGDLNVTGSGFFGGNLSVAGSGSFGGSITAPSAAIGTLNGNLNAGQIATAAFSQDATSDFNVNAPNIVGGRVKVMTNGNVGIGTNGPGYRLDVSSGAADSIRVHYNGSFWGVRFLNDAAPALNQGGIGIAPDGLLYATNQITPFVAYAKLSNNGSWTSTSDRRMKTDIAPLSGLLEKTLALQPVEYYFKNQDRALHPLKDIGFIAQDVEILFPSLLEGKDMKSLNYAGLSVVAIGAVKELNAKIEAQQKRIDALEAQVREMNALKKQAADIADLKKQLTALLEKMQKNEGANK